MTVLGALLKRSGLENPQVPISSLAIADMFPWGTSSLAGVTVNEDRVYGLSAWARGVTLTASTMAGLPFKVYRKSDKQRVTVRTVLDSPNRKQTPFEFWQTMYANALNYGTAYALKRRDGSGTVREAWSLHPSRVITRDVPASDLYPDGCQFLITNADGTQSAVGSWEIARFPYMSPHGTVGINALQAGKTSLGIAIAAENTSAEFYGQGGMVNGVLTSKQTLDQTQAEMLKARWRAKVATKGRATDIAVLDSDTTFQSIALTPVDAQFLESRKYGIAEIARFLGMPPELLGGSSGDAMLYRNLDGLTLGWVKFGLASWIQMVEQRVTREFLPGGWDNGSWYAEYSLEGLLRGDTTSRGAFYHQGILDGWLSRNEARHYENLEAMPGLDEFLIPPRVITLIQTDGTPEELALAPAATKQLGAVADDTNV